MFYDDPSITLNAQILLRWAYIETLERHCNQTGPVHILMAIPRAGPSVAGHLLEMLGVDVALLRTTLEGLSKADNVHAAQQKDVSVVMELACDSAKSFGHPYVGTEHILIAVLKSGDTTVGQAFERLGMSVEELAARAEAYWNEMIRRGREKPTNKLE
jgi:ATP-dependent Clp protease ATP-binding subunit ClpC